MNSGGVPPLIIIVLMAQSLFLAGWVVASIGILWGVLRQARAGNTMGQDDAAQTGVFAAYMQDPETRFRRWVWLGLTVGVVVIAVGLALVIRQV